MKKNIKSTRYADVSLRLRAVRDVFGSSQKQFAEDAGVEPKSYNQWESGNFRISIDGAKLLRERYGVSLDFIYCGSIETLPHSIASALLSRPVDKASRTSNENGED